MKGARERKKTWREKKMWVRKNRNETGRRAERTMLSPREESMRLEKGNRKGEEYDAVKRKRNPNI